MKKLFLLLLVIMAINANAQNTTSQTVNIQRFRFALQGGFSQLLAKTADAVPAELRNHVSELKSGYHYGGDVTYFVRPTWGLGLKFNQFRSSNSTMFYDEMMIAQGVEETRLVNTFIGPSLATKYESSSQKHMFLFNLAIGYMGYQSNTGMRIETTGGTVGSALDAGYDYRITKNIAIGAQLSIVGGVLSKVTHKHGSRSMTETFPDNQKESMARLDVSLGARFNF